MINKFITIFVISMLFSSTVYAVSTDTCFDTDTKLMMHANETSGSTTLADSSTVARTLTSNGNAQTSNARLKFNNTLLLDGTGDYLTTAASSSLDPGTGDFTVDFWVYLVANVGATLFEIGRVVAGPSNGMQLDWSGANINLYLNSGASTLSFARPSFNVWHHIAITRQGSTVRVWVDGVHQSSGTSSANLVGGASFGMGIGARSDGAQVMGEANFDEFRLVIGTAVWTGAGNFTSPSSEYSPCTARRRILPVTVTN